jgi:hypothetical protein
MMKRLANSRKAELDLGRRSKQLAEEERGLVAPDRLAQTISELGLGEKGSGYGGNPPEPGRRGTRERFRIGCD